MAENLTFTLLSFCISVLLCSRSLCNFCGFVVIKMMKYMQALMGGLPSNRPIIFRDAKYGMHVVYKKLQWCNWYCLSIQEKAWKLNVDDTVLGHIVVLSQYEWPKYESAFCDIIRAVRKRGQFTYNMFFSYIISILCSSLGVVAWQPRNPVAFQLV